MSINLCCDEMDLWQTPSYITDMCYEKPDGYPDKWKNIRHRYAIWVKSHSDGAWDSQEDLDYMKECIKNHLDHLYSHKKLNFYVM